MIGCRILTVELEQTGSDLLIQRPQPAKHARVAFVEGGGGSFVSVASTDSLEPSPVADSTDPRKRSRAVLSAISTPPLDFRNSVDDPVLVAIETNPIQW
jgi:hypothetical protein